MINIPSYDKYGGEKNIAILDNSSIEFLLELKNHGVEIIQILKEYDAVLLPDWVLKEVSHSEGRVSMLEEMHNKSVPVFAVAEVKYSTLLEYRDLDLYRVVLASASKLGEIKSYLRKNVRKEDPADMDDSSEWLRKLYDEWPVGRTDTSIQKIDRKNAGEVSITILAEIFSWYLQEVESITIYSQDRDAYDFEREATRIMQKSFQKLLPVTVTYKSNDAILLQLFRDRKINEEQIRDLRRNARLLSYTEVKSDKSVALKERLIDTDTFMQLIQNADIQILF